MSGTTTFLSDQAVMRAIAKRLSDPNATLTLAEETGFSRFVGNWTFGGTDPTGFPAAPGGDVNGWNSLCRTNWFNGRFLTAEALRRQDVYFDYRSRLDMHALMPGIAYGLGLRASGINNSDYNTDGVLLTGGFPATSAIMLLPGLAFDMIGRPILVPANFQFRLADLIALQKSKPRRVVGGGTEFAPCICLAPDPAGPTGGSAAPPPGPYLLIIEAAEHPSGDAKVYGTVCSDSQPVTCQSDAWCAGFGLSLVRFPVEVPETEAVQTPWDLRGIMSAYFFDVFEHSLIKRWDPPFATDDGFCVGTGPGRKDAGAVALAMVWLGTDGTALWIDSWIPRRSIVTTPGEDWHRTSFGAPPRNAAWARIHQFQCMLAESLTKQPMITVGGQFSNMNLLDRGFRHIPPIGFLPIEPVQSKAWTSSLNPATGDNKLDVVLKAGGAQAGLISGFVLAARREALSYFRNTNVIAYTVVALHDDDILEDLSNVFDKDPVQLDIAPSVDERVKAWFAKMAETATANPLLAMIVRLGEFLLEVGMDDLVNRRIEVVKLMVPLQGLVRRHPVVGVVAEDAANQAQDWGANAAFGTSIGAFDTAGLRQQIGLTVLPRQFVVYVKQRLVLLDVIYTTLELFQLVMRAVLQANQPASGDGQANAYVTTGQIRNQWQAMPSQQRAVVQAAMAHPFVQTSISRAVPLVQPDLAVASRAAAFQTQVDAQDTALQATVKDPVQRRQMAVDRVADSYAAVLPGYQFVQLLAATQQPADAELMVQTIGQSAGAVDALAIAPTATAEDAALLYAQVRQANAEKPIGSLLPSVKADISVGDVMTKSPAEATALLGGAQNYARFHSAYAAETKKAADAVTTVAAPPPPGAVEVVQTALDQSGGDIGKALDTTRTAGGHDAATRRYLDHAATIATLLGPSRTQALTPILLRRA